MKPFDLDGAKRGEPIKYRSHNTPVRYLGTLAGREHTPIAIAYTENDMEFVDVAHPTHLCMAPRKEKRWIVSWINKNGIFIANGYSDECYAKAEASRYKREGDTNVQIHETEVEL